MGDDTPHGRPLEDLHELTAGYIYHKEFRRALFGGYAMGEVDEFLERIGEAFEALVTRVQTLEAQNQQHHERLEAFRRTEETLHNALASAEKLHETIIDSAKREADSLIEQARMVKARAQLEAAQLPNEIAQEIQRLEIQRIRLRTDLQAILEAHVTLLESVSPAEERVEAEAAPPHPEPPAPDGDKDAGESVEDGKEVDPNAFFSGRESWE